MANEKTTENCVIVFNGVREHTLTADRATSMRLVPGKNIVSIDTMKKVRKGNEQFKSLEEEGELKVLPFDAVDTDPETGKTGVEVSKLSVAEVKQLIDGEIDIDVLQGYLDEEMKSNAPEGRPTAVKAIKDQMQALEDAAKEDDDSDGE